MDLLGRSAVAREHGNTSHYPVGPSSRVAGDQFKSQRRELFELYGSTEMVK